jgi:hypothetical protein
MRRTRDTFSTLISAAALALCLFAAALACAAPALAQFFDEGSAAAYWTLEKQRQDRQRAMRAPPIRQKPTHFISRAAPVRGFTRPAETAPSTPGNDETAGKTPADAQPAQTDAAASPTDTAAAQAPAVENPNAKAVIAVLGDNLGQLLSLGLSEAYADKPDIAVLRRTKENSGLVREDYYDWRKAARELLDKDKPDLAIIMVGSNDRQALRDGNASFDTRSPRWKELYAARVKAVGEIFRERKTPLIWVGLPIMNNERLAADMLDFNEIYKQAAAETGATYVDTWEAFADDRGRFSSYGPDVNGQMVRLRAGDGVHFTRAGSRKLAHFVEGDIRRILEKTKPSLDPSAIALTTPGEAPLLDVPGLGPSTPEPAGPEPVARPAIASKPVEQPAPPPVIRPAAGPVTPLTAPPVSPGGKLATAARPSLALGDKAAAALVQKSLVEGRAGDARPGRADDFAWPRDARQN